MQSVYGFKKDMPKDIDFYVLSNEDIGLNANLATGVNDVYSFALPYPSSIDLTKETIVVHAIEFIKQGSHNNKGTTAMQGLLAFLSMLDNEFAATFTGNASDSEDENLKAHFARNIYFGDLKINVTAAASVEGTERQNDTVVDAIYFPPVPLDLLTPLYIQFVNQSISITLATNAVAGANFTSFELVQIVVWFTRRKLTSAEMNARNMQLRFQRLDS